MFRNATPCAMPSHRSRLHAGFAGRDHHAPCAAQKRVLACRHHNTLGERLCGSSAKGNAEVAHKLLQARGAPHVRSGDAGREPFSEDPGGTAKGAAAKATNLQYDFHGAPVRRNISWPAQVTAVNMVRGTPAARTGGGFRRAGVDTDRVAVELNPIGRKPCWQKISARKP